MSLWDAFGKGRKPYVPPKSKNTARLDPVFYEQPGNYVPWDKAVPAMDISAINAQQALRDEYYRNWLKIFAQACDLLSTPVVYSVVESPFNFYDQPITCAILQFPTLDPTWAGAITPNQMDKWTPGQAAEILSAIAQ